MNDLNRIRFIAANYSYLKGLQTVIIGLLLLGTSLWNDKRQGNLSGPLIMLLVAAILWIAASSYYRRKYGQVTAKEETRQLETRISIAFGLLGLAAFVVDTYEIVPVSLLGIVFALGIWGDYLRINHSSKEKYLTYYPWFGIVLLVVSVLPALGLSSFWRQFGFNSQITGTMSLVGLILVILGFLGHLFLSGTFPLRLETDHDQIV